VVVLSKVFAADINTGYQDLCNVQLLRVDGVEVVNLGHVAALLEGAKGPFVKLELEWNKVGPRQAHFHVQAIPETGTAPARQQADKR
jgi:hypothetical protein